jgi:type II secretory pathway pseudopilin PulG
MAALVILALALTVCRLALDGITVRWRLRAAAHEVESVAQWALNAAASRGRPTRVLYDVPENCWWVQMGTETFAWHRLPQGVAFVSVRFPDGTEIMHDVAAVRASPEGTLDPHVVTLTGHSGEEVVLSFDRLTGEMTPGFTLVEVAASVAILGGVILGILIARNNAMAAHGEADQILVCTRLCAAQVAALRAGCAGEGEGRFVTPSGTYQWRITLSAPPEDSTAAALTAYEVAVWPAAPASDDTAKDSASPPTIEQPDEERGAAAILWLPSKPAAAGATRTP